MDHAGPGFRLVRGVAVAASVVSGGVLRRAEFERDAAIGVGPLVVDPVFTSENIPDISSNQDGPHIGLDTISCLSAQTRSATSLNTTP